MKIARRAMRMVRKKQSDEQVDVGLPLTPAYLLWPAGQLDMRCCQVFAQSGLIPCRITLSNQTTIATVPSCQDGKCLFHSSGSTKEMPHTIALLRQIW
jgi:hypothetical protein